MTISIYTDGACSGNPGIGGWGAIIILSEKKIIQINGGLKLTTNNQMELTAAIKALEFFDNPTSLELFTDSQYVKNGIELWIKNWKINGWKTASKKPVKNQDLWEKLDKQINKHEVCWKWVKGHAGNKYNELADILARKYIDES